MEGIPDSVGRRIRPPLAPLTQEGKLRREGRCMADQTTPPYGHPSYSGGETDSLKISAGLLNRFADVGLCPYLCIVKTRQSDDSSKQDSLMTRQDKDSLSIVSFFIHID